MSDRKGPFKKILGVLKQVAPTAAAALGGPMGGLAASIMKQKLGDDGMSDSSLADSIQRALGDPAEVLKLKEIEAALKQKEQELDIRFAELEVEDRAGARELAKQTSILPQVLLSALFISGYFVMMGLFFSSTLEVPGDDTFKVLAGVLTAAIPQILAFWFGSSAGSKRKTEALAGAAGRGAA